MTRVLAGAALLALLGGCGRETPAPAARPALERPVLTLGSPVGEHRKLLVPRQALVERAGIPGVFVLNDANEARFRLVKAGHVRDGQLEILSGLHGTETLVLGDLGDVHDGTPIRTK